MTLARRIVVYNLNRLPDEAKVKQKMAFLYSKDVLRRSLVDIAADLQATEFSEMAFEAGKSLFTISSLLSNNGLVNERLFTKKAATVI